MKSLQEIETLEKINQNNGGSIFSHFEKLGEEFGELNAAQMRYMFDNTDVNRNDVLYEAADNIQILVAILYNHGFTLEEIDKAISVKNIKWRTNYLKK